MKIDKKSKKDIKSNSLIKDKDIIAFIGLYSRLKLRYNKLELLNMLDRRELFIPLSIFNKKLSSLEVISKYLFENENLSLKSISNLLNRSNRNIWNSYDRSKKKFPKKLLVKESILLPISILKNLDFTLLENIILYLKETLELSYHEIAVLLHRDDRTIWTVYNRLKKKKENKG